MTGQTLTCYTTTQTLTASVPLAGVRTVPVLSTVVAPPRSSPSHTTGVQHWGTAGRSPGTVVVTVLLRPALCSGVDSPQLRVTHCGFVALPADVSLVGVNAGSSGFPVTLLASDRTSVREPETCLTIVTCSQ